MHEQRVPLSLELDGRDENAIHLLALTHENLAHANLAHASLAIGCARILAPENAQPGSIGRMAVLKDWRQKGVGMALLQSAIEIFHKQHWHEITLSAQTHAIGFYQKAGFVICSDEYLDAGILHCDMKLL